MMFVDKGYRHNQLNWKFKKLYRGKEFTGFELEQDLEHTFMWRIVRKPDFRSKQIYNLINAKENTRLFYLKFMNSDVEDINLITLQEPLGSSVVSLNKKDEDKYHNG